MPVKKPIVLNQEENTNGFSDEQTDKRIHEHLMNEHDEISAEDIGNVKTNVVAQEDEKTDEDNNEEMTDDKLIGDDLENRKVKDDSDPEIDTIWNILES